MEHQVILFSGLLLGAVYALIGLQLVRWLFRHIYWKSHPDTNWLDQSQMHLRPSHVNDLRGIKYIIQ